jgi:dipicolinate synthase subunit A
MADPNRTYAPAWRHLTIAIVGGDEREQEIARLAAESGARVTAFGFPWPPGGIPSVELAQSASAALTRAHVALFPIPGIAVDGSLFGTEKIIPSQRLLSVMAPSGHIILGKADQGLQKAATAGGIHLHEYESDRELMLLRAPAIVEAAVRIIIENTLITIHGASICVVGMGNIGTVLVRTLIALGAHVAVAARNPVQLAAAYTLGATPLSLEQLPDSAAGFDVILSTAPAPVVSAPIIDRLPAHALVMDLTAPPGSCDLQYATQSGRKAIWARALGRRAPVTVGASQWRGIAKIIDLILSGSE